MHVTIDVIDDHADLPRGLVDHSHVGRTRHDVLARRPLEPAPDPQLAPF
ncbi:hypothetical protein [Sphingomonas bacterium]|nr:hypothetical protein [Sphingomonas bacterium]